MAIDPGFNSIPILPLSEARNPATKHEFLLKLKDALLNVGFLYLSETGIPSELWNSVVEQSHRFFEALPQEDKDKIDMINQPSFLGWNQVDNETTAHNPDHREQFEISTPHPLPGPESPRYHNLLAPNQWPSPSYLPEFRSTFEEYVKLMGPTSVFFTSLIAEAIGLKQDAFDRFFDEDQQHKLKIVKYPELETPEGLTDEESAVARQGVGPHKDSMLTSYLLQATPGLGLQAQNQSGAWIDVPPIPGTLVVAIGQGMEALTGGVCASTTHRVLSPKNGEGARLSVPFFQGVSYDAVFENMEVPAEMRELADEMRRKKGDVQWDKTEFTFSKGKWNHLGEATLWNRVKSHQDVGQKWYPDLLAKIKVQQAEEAKIKSK